MALSSVLFPAPLGPISVTISPPIDLDRDAVHHGQPADVAGDEIGYLKVGGPDMDRTAGATIHSFSAPFRGVVSSR